MFPLLLATAGIGAIGSIIHGFGSGARHRALMAQDPTYSANPEAQKRLGMAQTLLNARMPGASAMERNIYGNQANQLANVNRNATDSSQALALGAAAQGQTNQAFQNLGVQEQQDYYNRLQNYTGAQQGVIQEGDKVYQDKVRRFQDLAGLQGAAEQNTQNSWNSIANLGFGGAGIASQFGMMNGGGQRSVNPSAASNSFMGMQPQSGTPGYSSPQQGWINPYGAQGGVSKPWGQ